MKLNLQKRTFLVFGIVILLSGLLALTGYYTISKTSEYNEYANSFSELKEQLLQARRDEKDFIARDTKDEEALTSDTSKYFGKNAGKIVNILGILTDLKAGEIATEFGQVDSITMVENGLIEYQKLMSSLFDNYKVKGFVNVGLEGELRSAIKEVFAVEKEIIALGVNYDRGYSLMLRRHEKDFFLRSKTKYVGKFETGITDYKSYLEKLKTSSSDSINVLVSEKVAVISPLLDEYKSKFIANVEATEKVGLDHKSGIKGEIREKVHVIEGVFNKLFNSVIQRTKAAESSLLIVFWILFGIEILVAAFVAMKFSTRLLEAIQKIKDAMTALSSGEYPEDVAIQTGDELEVVGSNVNELRDRISTAAEFSKEIGSGNLEIQYEDRFSNDVLAKAIIDMREKLKVNAAEERERAWHTEGIAKFGGILQEEKDDINELSKTLVSHLVNYLGANQAGIFVVNDENAEDQYLELTGAYAYERDKHIEMKVQKGEGLIGQCWLEKKRIFMTDIPDSYINITSGLGEASPNCVIILPLPYNEDILGVLEMASFTKFSEAEIQFLEDLAKTIAATLSGVRIASRTKFLLEESKMMQESLQAQEEEMRQNMEEMQATQDMMTQKENDYNDQIKGLQKQLRALNEKNDEN